MHSYGNDGGRAVIFDRLFLKFLWKPLFLKWMQNSLERVGGYDRSSAAMMARHALNDHLKDNKIYFGDRSFTWGKKDAEEICYEYVMRDA